MKYTNFPNNPNTLYIYYDLTTRTAGIDEFPAKPFSNPTILLSLVFSFV